MRCIYSVDVSLFAWSWLIVILCFAKWSLGHSVLLVFLKNPRTKVINVKHYQISSYFDRYRYH